MTVDENLTPAAESEATASVEAVVEASLTEPATAEVAPTEAEPAATEVVETATEAAAPSEPVVEATPAPVVAETPAPAVVEAPVSEGVTTKDDSDLFEQYMNALDSGEAEAAGDTTYKRLSKGDLIEATVIQVDNDRVFVNLGTKAEGVIPLAELSEQNLSSAIGYVNVDDKLNVVVLNPTGSDGNPTVSRKRAEFEEQWARIIKAHEEGTTIEAPVIDRVKGGLVVDIGVRGFVPATHVGNGKLRNIDKYVGQPLKLKVIELERERKKVVLSNRMAEEETRGAAKDEVFKNIKVGDVLDGTVRRLADYGAFVDLGGVDGLLHISEMSWARISHPKEMFKEGQDIKVMVLRLDPGVGKISLGHRQVLPDPWQLIKQNYKIGQTLKVNVGRLVTSGAFVKLEEGAEAFLPLSEMSYRRLKRPQDVVEENQEVEVQVIDLRADERRMVLSMRALGGGGELRPGAGMDEEYRKPRTGPGGPRGGGRGGRGGGDDDSRRGIATGGATIGERLGMLKGLLKSGDDSAESGE
jgi:4-hydroxy-3-methylbut-2-enyl diphosphate reductase